MFSSFQFDFCLSHASILLYIRQIRENFGGGKKTIFSYLIPYVFFTFVVGSIIAVLFSIVFHYSFEETVMNMFKEIFYKIGSDAVLMGSLWFLGVLIMAQLIVRYILTKRNLCNSLLLFDIMVFVLLSLSGIFFSKLSFRMPFRIAAVPVCTLFVYTGYLYADKVLSIMKNIKIWQFFLILLAFLYFHYVNGYINISTPIYNDYYLFLINSFFGISIVFWLSSRINNKFLSFVGEKTLVIFSIHQVWLLVFSILLSEIVGEKIRYMQNMPEWGAILGGVFVLAASILSYYIINPFYKKFFEISRKIIKF